MYKIKELRIEKNLSQKQLAKKLGISQSVICDYENGKAEPTAPIIIAMAIFFDVTSDYLLGLEDETGGKYINSFNNFNFNGHDMNIK